MSSFLNLSIISHYISKSPPTIYSASTSILRPNGSGLVVIRPGSQLYNRPYHTRSTTTTSTTTTTTEKPDISNEVIQHGDLQGSNSISTVSWAANGWQLTTQPNFITKPKPPVWEKPSVTRPKPKPTKKPTTTSQQFSSSSSNSYHSTTFSTDRTTTKPKPQVRYFSITFPSHSL